MAYFLFFFNGIFGFVMCILRGVGVIIFTAVMLFRLDWDIYMRGLEGWDMGKTHYTVAIAHEAISPLAAHIMKHIHTLKTTT